MARHLVISTSTELVRIAPERIIYLSSDGNYSTLVQRDGESRTLTFQLGQIEKLIETQLGQEGNTFIRIGKNTKIGPNCQFYTPNHPMGFMERRKPQETGYPITIGEDCWIAGGVTICPGVTIGKRCIIAAGSVVTKDVPDDSLVAGVPAIIKRKLK